MDMMIVKDKSGNIFHSRTDNLIEISIHSTNAKSQSLKPDQAKSSAVESAASKKLRNNKRNNRRTGDAGIVSPSLFG
jgi:hypothetical protein